MHTPFWCIYMLGREWCAGWANEVWLWWILLFVVNWVTQEPGIDANESQDQELDAEKWEACISPHLVSRSLRAGEKCRQSIKCCHLFRLAKKMIMQPSFSFGKEDERPWLIPANAMEHIFNWTDMVEQHILWETCFLVLPVESSNEEINYSLNITCLFI